MKIKRFLLTILILSTLALLFSCGNGNSNTNKYTVTFDSDGGSSVESQTVAKNSKITQPTDPTKEGHIFKGWYNGNTQWSFENDTVKNNVTLTAKWEKNKYTVTFDPGEGTVCEPTRQVNHGEAIGILPTPYLDGWKFLGWYDSDDIQHENKITKNYIVKASTRLVVLWKKTETLDPIEHSWSEWAEYSAPTCVAPQKLYRTCDQCYETEFKDGQPSSGHNWSDWMIETHANCNDNEVLYRKCPACGEVEKKDGADALGHSFGAFSYGLLSHAAYCSRCHTSVVFNYENLASSIKKTTISGDVLGAENVDCLYNGNWDEIGGTFCARGGSITVNIEFEQPTDADIIYVKGKGYYSYSVYVLYEGDSEYTVIGIGSFGSEACRFNLDRKITKISIQMENGGNLDGYWQEVAILKVPENQ